MSEFQQLPTPILTPLQFEASRRHMVTVSRFHKDQVWLIDPMEGYVLMSPERFERYYRGQAIVFEKIR